MNLNNIKSIKMSLLKKDSDINEEHKAEYIKSITGNFVIPSDFTRSEDAFKLLTQDIFKSLNEENTKDVDYVGIWIELDDSTILENAISLQTLDDISSYSSDPIVPIFEFFKMTLPE
jgi:hypothetical protein